MRFACEDSFPPGRPPTAVGRWCSTCATPPPRFGLTAVECQTLANIARPETNERAAQAEGVSVSTIESA